jgi:hypothetical protein
MRVLNCPFVDEVEPVLNLLEPNVKGPTVNYSPFPDSKSNYTF